MSSLTKLLDIFSDRAARPSIVQRDITYSYGELLEEFHAWSGRLVEMQIGRGCVIGLRTDYSIAGVAGFLALLAHGAIPALIPRDRSVAQYLTHSCASGLLDVNQDATHKYTVVPPPILTHHLLKDLAAGLDSGFVIFTSGSTGPPKAALHSFERFIRKFDRPGRSLRTLAFLLFDHIAGLDTLFYTLWNGGTLVFTERRDPKAILQLIESQRVEVLPSSPSFLRLLCSAPAVCYSGLSSLKIITYGSEPMDPATLRRVNERFPTVKILQKYGTTELGAPQTVSRSNDSIWLKFKCDPSQIKVVDGILWLHSEGAMLGYINVPSPENQNGWYCTGDLVEVDGEWLRFLGRADDVIKVGGEKVSPSEVERVIRELGFVKDAFVSGEPHPLLGQVVAAQIVLAMEYPASSDVAACVRRHCRCRLGPHHAPVRITLRAEGASQPIGYRLKVLRPPHIEG